MTYTIRSVSRWMHLLLAVFSACFGKDARPTDFVELRFIKELEDSGFIHALYE